jgi:hypothetical protein
MLADIYDAQRALNHRTVGFDVCTIEDEDTRLAWFRNYLTAWDQELKELLESLDRNAVFRGGLTDGFVLDVQNVQIEVVDMLHFLVSLFQVIGEPGIRGERVDGSPESFDAYLARLASDHEAFYGLGILSGNDDETMNRLLVLHGLHAAVETGQVLDTVQWKWWARQGSRWDEALDALYARLFPRWCHLVLASGMDGGGVRDLYMKKNKLNFERQEGGYKEGTYRKTDESGREDNVKLFDKKES